MDKLMNALENLKQIMLTSQIDLDTTGLWIGYLGVFDAAKEKMMTEAILSQTKSKALAQRGRGD